MKLNVHTDKMGNSESLKFNYRLGNTGHKIITPIT